MEPFFVKYGHCSCDIEHQIERVTSRRANSTNKRSGSIVCADLNKYTTSAASLCYRFRTKEPNCLFFFTFDAWKHVVVVFEPVFERMSNHVVFNASISRVRHIKSLSVWFQSLLRFRSSKIIARKY